MSSILATVNSQQSAKIIYDIMLLMKKTFCLISRSHWIFVGQAI